MSTWMVVCIAAACAAAAAALVFAVMFAKLAAARAVSAARVAELAAVREQMEMQKEHYESVMAGSEKTFRDLAQKVLEERSEKLKKEGGEQLKGVVDPLLKDLHEFRRKMEMLNSEAAERGGKLDERIKSLAEKTATVTAEAKELAEAIRGDSQVIGEWGEIQLRRVLEISGLQENTDYTYQDTLSSADSSRKNLRTDVQVKMPDGRVLVIDSKNTVESYVEFANAKGESREALREKIVVAVKGHVDELVRANYAANVKNACEWTLMYIPFEEVYLIAMKGTVKVGGERRLLRDYAREHSIVFVNSTSLVPVLRLVELAWQKKDSDKKTERIAQECSALCRKAETFLRSYAEVGKTIRKLSESYNQGLGQLSTGPGNLVKKLGEIGSLAPKQIAALPTDEDYSSANALPDSVQLPAASQCGKTGQT